MTVQELKNQIHNEFAAWEDELMRKVAPAFPLLCLFLTVAESQQRGLLAPRIATRAEHSSCLLSICEQIPLSHTTTAVSTPGEGNRGKFTRSK